MKNDKTQLKELREKLCYEKKPCFEKMTPAARKKAFSLADDYKVFLDRSKTERDCVAYSVMLAEKNGFCQLSSVSFLKPGDKVYSVNREKALMLAVVGEKPLEEGLSILGAHIDSPRIDLKQVPLYEDGGLCLMKTHYYGGIKKYHWPAMPLEMRGVVIRADGEKIYVSIGADPKDPVFTITDLLPHLAKDQMKKTMTEGFEGESLNLLVGSHPVDIKEDGADKIKLAVLSLLHEKYGITEADFLSAELSLVPAFNARDVGLDRSMIGAYGQDDRICAYAGLRALFEIKKPVHTAICILADKEETGSDGVTGMKSAEFELFIQTLSGKKGISLPHCFKNSICLSADVLNAFDPTYASVSEKRNNVYLGYGLGVVKYTGARGKADTSDASAELTAQVRTLLDAAGICWQTGELGAVDQGGGGTIAKYMANRNIDVIDAGTPVLSMHSPFEIASKLDLYETMRGYAAFYNRQ